MSNQPGAVGALNTLIDLLERCLPHVAVRASSKWSHSRWDTDTPIGNEFEISYTLSGTRSMVYGSVPYTGRPGELMFWDSLTTGSQEAGYFTYAYIIFSLDDRCPAFDRELETLHACFRELDKFACPAMERHAVEALFQEAATELIAIQSGYGLSAKLALLRIVIAIRRFLLQAGQDRPERYDRKHTDLAADMIGYLAEHLDRRVTLDELGDRYGKNPRHLNRVFKSVTGYPVLHYINRMKVEKAKRLLLSSAMNQLEIALELGLRSGQYFNQFFRKETGMTPAQYRKSIRRAGAGSGDPTP